jgi:hypothetical protein
MRFQVEDARSLPTFGDAWSLVDDEPDRPNPSIDHGRITSLQGSLGVSWDGNTIEGSASLGLEGAARVAGGDFAFGRFEIDAVAALAALANHSLLVEWRARGPIPGTDSLPQQRWSALGGRGTLYTHDILSLRGDRMVYLETEYLIPIPVLESAPIIGRPAIGLVHHAGMSWSSSQPREFEQNLGLRLRLRLLWVLGMIDPEDTDRNGLFIGIGLPLRYPWWPDTL